MSEIAVIGLGAMGTALAQALVTAGHSVTVWNRTPQKMEPLVELGAKGAESVVDAVQTSPRIMVCIDNYVATKNLLGTEDVVPHLSGRTLIQLSTGTPKEAREASEWMTARNVAYLDGAILCSPEAIGTDEAQILLSGDEAAYGRAGNLLECLGGVVRYLGTNIRAASALDLAWLCTCYGRFMAIIHAASMCKSEGVGIGDFISLFPDQPDIRRYAKVIHEERFQERTATLQVWGAALQRIQQQGVDADINTDIPDFVASFFKKAVDAGYGEENVMALVKVLNGDSGN